MYDHTLLNLQIIRSDIRPHIKWPVSLVIAYGHFNLPEDLCGYVWVYILTYSPTVLAKNFLLHPLYIDSFNGRVLKFFSLVSTAFLQELADCFATAAKMFGLTVSIKKTEVLRQLAPNTVRPPPNIAMDGNALKNVDTFKYLGSCINSAANLDDKVLCLISRASQAFGRLHTRVWHERGTSIKTKLRVYRAVVLPSLLYGCETWTCYRRHIKKLDQFHLHCLRKVLRVSWKDHVPNQEILRRAELTGIEAMLNLA